MLWELVVHACVWMVCTHTKLCNGHYAPYDIVTGLKPRSPIDAIVADGVAPTVVLHPCVLLTYYDICGMFISSLVHNTMQLLSVMTAPSCGDSVLIMA